MIDWITCEIPCLHSPLNSGRIIKLNPSGEIDWESPSRTTVEGSYSDKVSVISHGHLMDGKATTLRISGNPSKFLQGHNVFGIDDLSRLMHLFTTDLFDRLDIHPRESDIDAIIAGDYTVSRIDINYGFRLKSRTDVLSWIRAAEHKAKTRRSRSLRSGDTIYFGKHSRRWTLKFYSKGEEIQVHKLPDELQKTPIAKYADSILRAEICLRGMELRERNLHRATELTPEMVKKLFNEYMERLDMTGQQTLSDEIVTDLPRYLQATYLLWNTGADPKKSLTERTYYRHRSELLKYGVDINFLPDSITKMDNVVPLVRVLEAVPAEIPTWAYEQNLIAC